MPNDDERCPAVLTWYEDGHDGPGWYYYAAEYPDEGSVGSFTTCAEAIAHGLEDGYSFEACSDG